MKKRGLGRGFDSLIPTDLLDESFDPTAGDDQKVSELRHIQLTEISADPEQPRRHFEEEALHELAASIKKHGILQPVVVVSSKNGYQIVAGERRWRAAKLAGLDTVPALVRTLSAQHKLELALIENLQRRDLNALETATAYKKLRDQFNLTLDQIADSIGGKSISAISNTLRLLKLPKIVQQAVARGELSEGAARPLIGLDPAEAEELLPKIIQEGWSARRIEQVIHARKQSSAQSAAAKKSLDTYKKQRDSLAKKFNTEVKVRESRKGTGQIVISFSSHEEFERLTKELL